MHLPLPLRLLLLRLRMPLPGRRLYAPLCALQGALLYRPGDVSAAAVATSVNGTAPVVSASSVKSSSTAIAATSSTATTGECVIGNKACADKSGCGQAN